MVLAREAVEVVESRAGSRREGNGISDRRNGARVLGWLAALVCRSSKIATGDGAIRGCRGRERKSEISLGDSAIATTTA